MRETETFEMFDWPVDMDFEEKTELLGTNLKYAIKTLMANALTRQQIGDEPLKAFRVKVTALYGEFGVPGGPTSLADIGRRS